MAILSKQKKKTEDAVKAYCKARDKYICQHCKKTLEKGNCHGSHVIPVSAGNQYRFDPLNIKTLCYHCHLNWWHKNPVEAGEWFKEKFPERHEYLFGKPRETVKFTVEELQEMEKHYKVLTEQLYNSGI
jgi:5-methylcytosine-specific restriction endonuclease McrA